MSVLRNYLENNLIPRLKVMAIRTLKYKKYTDRVAKNAMSAISVKVYVRAEGVRVLPYGNYLTSDRDIYVE